MSHEHEIETFICRLIKLYNKTALSNIVYTHLSNIHNKNIQKKKNANNGQCKEKTELSCSIATRYDIK